MEYTGVTPVSKYFIFLMSITTKQPTTTEEQINKNTKTDVSDSLFYIDDSTNNPTTSSGEEEESTPQKNTSAWQDEDDEILKVDLLQVNRSKKLRHNRQDNTITGIEYSKRLREYQEDKFPRPKWAQTEDKDVLEDDSENEHEEKEEEWLSNNPLAVLSKKAKSETPLPSDSIALRRLQNLHLSSKRGGNLSVLQFHPVTGMPYLLAGNDAILTIFKVSDNQETPTIPILNMSCRDWKGISSASFSSDGTEIFVAAKGPGFMSWKIDYLKKAATPNRRLERVLGCSEGEWKLLKVSKCGRWIAITGKKESKSTWILCAKTLQFLGKVVMNSLVECIEWSVDGNTLYTAGKDCRIYVWRRLGSGAWKCQLTINDESGTSITSLSISPDDSFLSTGSNLGIASVYDVKDPSKPIKTFLQLTTQITSLAFHPLGEMMIFASKDKQNQLRITHFPTCGVFSNWPKSNTPLGHVDHLSISVCGKYLSLHNGKGSILLYQFKHYIPLEVVE